MVSDETNLSLPTKEKSVVAHALNHSTQKADVGSKSSLFYKVRSKEAKATQSNPVSEKEKAF